MRSGGQFARLDRVALLGRVLRFVRPYPRVGYGVRLLYERDQRASGYVLFFFRDQTEADRCEGSIYAIGPIGGPALGTLVGSYITLGGWRAVFWSLFGSIAALTVVIVLFLEETYGP